MQVALNYYRMLSVPVQAEEPQIEQAYRERAGLPYQGAASSSPLWQGLSAAALEARSKLLDEAVMVLLNAEQRQYYDTQLMAQPHLQVNSELLPGAMVLLYEAGDYPAAHELAGLCQDLETEFHRDANLISALARLEMGRESWQKHTYEEAAVWLDGAHTDLQSHRLFPELQAEILADLGKLRPYRVLQLLHEPPEPETADSRRDADSLSAHERGLILLHSMLEERQGIEGHGQDGSGLTTEDFLRFIQRTRRHMMAAEQVSLFQKEMERPSMVAMYLAVQVQMGQGYLEKRPALIRTARGLLARLAQHQDVHLEQSICHLLLGETEIALQHLQQMQEPEPLAFIREHSQGSPDLLPGLCRYAEKWFQEEVLSQIRDLDSAATSLQEYFDNPQVQAYLDEMLSTEEQVVAGDTAPPLPFAPVSQRWKTQELSPVQDSPYALQGLTTGASTLAAETKVTDTPMPREPKLDFATSRRAHQAPSAWDSDAPHSSPVSSEPERSRSTQKAPAAGGPRPGKGGETLPPRMAELPTHQGPPPSRSSRLDNPYPPSMRHRARKRPTPQPEGGIVQQLWRNNMVRLSVSLGILAFAIFLIIRVGQLIISPPQPQDPTLPSPDEPPQVDLNQPPVDVATSPSPNLGSPEPSPQIPTQWQGVSQVRVISADGVNIRQEPALQSPRVGTAASRALLTVEEVQLSLDPQISAWLRVSPSQGAGGWIAVEFQGTPLVERVQ